MHYAVPRIFHGAGRLERLFTDLAAPGCPARLAAAAPLRRLFSRRPAIPAARITQFPALGLSAALLTRLVRSEAQYLRLCMSVGRRFCARIVRYGFGRAEAVYGFNSASLELFRAAGDVGLFRILEQTNAAKHLETRLLEEERAAWPGWAPDTGPGEAAAEFAAREAAEWSEADLVVCGSEFARRSVLDAAGPAARCHVVPYGVDIPPAAPRPARQPGVLHVLFSGTAGLRKGVPYLMDAARRLAASRFRIRLVGPLSIGRAGQADLARRCELSGCVPRPAMAAHYRWADVFVLPSICEGSATVCYEALAAGLPVVTTPNAGSVVRDGLDGYVVAPRDARAIAEKLELLAADPRLLARLSANAAARAQEFTVARYAERLLSLIAV